MIPMSRDVRELIGEFAENVDNRSLLYEKFSLPKVWGHDRKLDDAGRWSILRIVSGGDKLLNSDADDRNHRARGKNVKRENAQRLQYEAVMAGKMARFAKTDAGLVRVSNENSQALLRDVGRSFGGSVVTFEATLAARLMVNMAGGVIENAGICLDRCFGLPLIPGSAVKGIARAQALWEIKESPAAGKPKLLSTAMAVFGYGKTDIGRRGAWTWAAGEQVVHEVVAAFGAEHFKGCACFLPAYPTTPPTLVVDMVNPHYPEYYRGRRATATDDEGPLPNYFPAVAAGSAFGFAVLLNRVPQGFEAGVLLDAAKGWIERAITQKGVGAKTAAGYGWFQLGASKTQAMTTGAPVSTADELIGRWHGRLATIDNFGVALPEIAALKEDADLRRVFEAVIPLEERQRNRRNNPYWQSFTSGRHGEAGRRILARVGFTLV